MKIQVNKDHLIKALALVTPLCKSNTGALDHVLVEPQSEFIQLSAHNGQIKMVCSVAAKIKDPKNFAVNGKLFQQIVGNFLGDSVELSQTSAKLTIRSGESTYKLNTIEAAQYPTFELSKTATVQSYKGIFNDFLDQLAMTAASAAGDMNKPTMHGVYFEPTTTQFTLVATDSHRFSLFTPDLKLPATNNGILLPLDLVEQLVRLRSKAIVKEVFTSPNLISFKIDADSADFAGPITFISRIMSSSFPAYQSVLNPLLSSKEGVRVQVEIPFLQQALKRINAMLTDNNNRLNIEVGNNMLTIKSASQELGESEERLPVNYTGTPFSFVVNGITFLDISKHMPEQSHCEFVYLKPAAPLLFKDKNWLHLLMPIRT